MVFFSEKFLGKFVISLSLLLFLPVREKKVEGKQFFFANNKKREYKIEFHNNFFIELYSFFSSN